MQRSTQPCPIHQQKIAQSLPNSLCPHTRPLAPATVYSRFIASSTASLALCGRDQRHQVEQIKGNRRVQARVACEHVPSSPGPPHASRHLHYPRRHHPPTASHPPGRARASRRRRMGGAAPCTEPAVKWRCGGQRACQQHGRDSSPSLPLASYTRSYVHCGSHVKPARMRQAGAKVPAGRRVHAAMHQQPPHEPRAPPACHPPPHTPHDPYAPP